MATVRKKVDNRIRVQIENGVSLQNRSMFVVVGDRGRDQVIRHLMLSQSSYSVISLRKYKVRVERLKKWLTGLQKQQQNKTSSREIVNK